MQWDYSVIFNLLLPRWLFCILHICRGLLGAVLELQLFANWNCGHLRGAELGLRKQGETQLCCAQPSSTHPQPQKPLMSWWEWGHTRQAQQGHSASGQWQEMGKIAAFICVLLPYLYSAAFICILLPLPGRVLLDRSRAHPIILIGC